MNQKFYELPKEKQDRIINAGFEVFAKNEYRKAPMLEIAEKAGISKSLLFHYFKNKKEYYLFLFEYGIQYIEQMREREQIEKVSDLFEIYEIGLRGKLRVMRDHLYSQQFIIKAYYDDKIEVGIDVKKRFQELLKFNWDYILSKIDRTKLRETLDLEMVMKNTLWCSDGYMRQQMQAENIDIDKIEKEYMELIRFWKQTCYKEEHL